MASVGARPSGRSRRASIRSSSSAAAPARSRSSYFAEPPGGRPRGDLGGPGRRAACSGAGRSSSACCRGPSRTRRRARADAAPTSATTGTASSPRSPSSRGDPGRVHGRHVVDSRRAPRWSRTSPTFAERGGIADPLRLPLGSTRREDGPTATGSSLVTTDGEYRCRARSSRSASPSRGRRDSPGMDLVAHYADTRPAETYAGQAPLHRRQAEQRLRAGVGPAPVGEPDHPRVAVAGEAVGQHAFAGRRPGALRPAVRGPRARRRRRHPRRGDRDGSKRAGDAFRVHAPPQRHVGRAVDRGRRGDRGDRLHVARCGTCPALGVATFGQSKLPALTAVLGERDGARASTSPGRSARASAGSRSTACRRTRAPSTAPATTPGRWPGTSRRRGSGSSWRGRRSPPADVLPYLLDELDARPGGLAPAVLPRAGR